MLAELVGDSALRRQDAPIRLFRRMGPAQHVVRLLQAAIIGERAAIGAEQFLIVGMDDHGAFQDGERLGVLVERAQGPRIEEGGVAVALVRFIALAPIGFFATPLRLGARLGLPGPDRAGDVAGTAAHLAGAEREAEGGDGGELAETEGADADGHKPECLAGTGKLLPSVIKR